MSYPHFVSRLSPLHSTQNVYPRVCDQCVFYGISTQIPILFNNKQQKVQIARQSCNVHTTVARFKCTVPKTFTRGYVTLVLFLFDNVRCRINGNCHSQPIICEHFYVTMAVENFLIFALDIAVKLFIVVV
jgi:hypothetical protein